MVRLVRDLRFTLAATAVAAVILLTHVDLWALGRTLLAPLEAYAANTLLCGLTVLCGGCLLDLLFRFVRKRRQAEAQSQKLKTHQATMRTVLHIVNNFLNGLLLFELEAEPVVSREAFEELERLVQQTHGKLTALGDLDSLQEISTPTGDAIELPGVTPPSLIPAPTPQTSLR